MKFLYDHQRDAWVQFAVGAMVHLNPTLVVTRYRDGDDDPTGAERTRRDLALCAEVADVMLNEYAKRCYAPLEPREGNK